jgi:hypothetical protein
MSEVHTRDEALTLIDQACQEWGQALSGILAQAGAVASGAQARAGRVVARCKAKVSAIEAVLAAADRNDLRRLEAELVRARASYDTARRAAVRVSDVTAAIGHLGRANATCDTPQLAAARRQLAELSRAIEVYRRSRAAVVPQRTVAARANPGGPAPLDRFGLSNLRVNVADLTDTPLQGEFGRGGASMADYRWAVQTWNDTVGPGVAKGMTRDDFAARDLRGGALPLRKTADVYDMFLGTGRIHVAQRPDGSLNIVNGRHRFQVARDLGITSLPGQMS